MTTIADELKRVVLSAAKPGDCFDVQIAADGSFLLRRLEPNPLPDRPVTVTLVNEGGYTVGVLDRPIDEAALKQALADFP